MDPAAVVDEERWRSALSALLDGEEPPIEVAAIMTHLAACPACSTWLDQATAVNRDLRTLRVLDGVLGERVVNSVDVHLCGCRTGAECLCNDCQCGPHCTCHTS